MYVLEVAPAMKVPSRYHRYANDAAGVHALVDAVNTSPTTGAVLLIVGSVVVVNAIAPTVAVGVLSVVVVL